MQEIKGHTTEQPGLRGHSHDPENDLLKRFVVAKKVKHGWLWLQTFNTMQEAGEYAWTLELDTEFKIMDRDRQK